MKTLRGKIMLDISLIVCISLLVVGSVAIMLNMYSTNSALEQTMKETAEIAAQRISKELDVYASVAYEIGSNARLSNGAVSTVDKRSILEQKIQTYQFSAGDITDITGKGIFTGTDYSQTPYFQAAMRGEKYIQEPHQNSQTGSFGILVAAPLWKDGLPNTTVVGMVCLSPTETILDEMVTALQVSPGGSSYMLGSSGNTIAHKNHQNVINAENTAEDAKSDKQLAQLAMLEGEMIRGASGFGKYTYGGVEKFLAYAPIIGSNGWSIGINAPLSDFMGKTYLSILILVALGLIAITVSIASSVVLAKNISKPVVICTHRLELLEQGDFTSPMEKVNSQNETGILARALESHLASLNAVLGDADYMLGEIAQGNFAVESKATESYIGDFSGLKHSMVALCTDLSSTFSQINLASEQVAGGSDQVSSGAQALSQGATQQASSIEELAATIGDVSAKINSNAQNAQVARKTVDEVEQQLLSSNQKMGQMTTAMDQISDSAKEIGIIIKAIEDIAFKTNILALNAAVEAARAGVAGRGFAVVADEVRNLASQSAEASKGTASLIETSLRAVENGTKIARATADSVGSVVEGTKQIVSQINSIALASEEQALAVHQITQGVDQIAAVVQTNSATAEESAAASEELSAQSALLKNLVRKFKLQNTAYVVPQEGYVVTPQVTQKPRDSKMSKY